MVAFAQAVEETGQIRDKSLSIWTAHRYMSPSLSLPQTAKREDLHRASVRDMYPVRLFLYTFLYTAGVLFSGSRSAFVAIFPYFLLDENHQRRNYRMKTREIDVMGQRQP
jgi:hypothetical protein